jgi:hypothetical protein
MRRILLAILFLIAGTGAALAHGDIKFHLQLSMQSNDARGIASYVEEAISFEYKNTRSVKGKADVEKILTSFFSQNKYKAFAISNQGTFKNGIRHMEGIYETTNNQKFQVYFEAVYDEKEAHHHLSKIIIEKIEEN